MKIINIKDLNKKILYLDRGEYLINGKRYSLPNYYDNKIEVEDLKELRKINITTITTGYYDEINQKEISVKEYENIKEKLLIKSYKDDEETIQNIKGNISRISNELKEKCQELEEFYDKRVEEGWN